MLSIKQINENDIDLCCELDSKTISLWSKKQWTNEFKKEGTKIFGLFLSNIVIGIFALHVVLDEAHINYFAVKQKYREKGLGSYFMNFLIKKCKKLNINKLLLEVSNDNSKAEKFYNSFDFYTVGTRKNYYKDGSDALLKEKKINNKII